MPQKILAGRAHDPQLKGDTVSVKVDQVILARAPGKAVAEALALGMKKTGVEVAVAYDGRAVTDKLSLDELEARAAGAVGPELPAMGIPIARAGVGFPAPVHLERFGAPARLALTDDPRIAPVGGVGMLALVASPAQLGTALATGMAVLRPPRSIQVHLSGRVRPFVCARDVALELMRRGLDEIVSRIEKEHAAPVVLEFAGPSARLLSVQERAVLAGIAPHVGAAASLFVSDEKTEVFLRDQRRSKAHRALVPDPGAPCEDVVSIDLATVDPLLMDETGQVRPVRDLAGKPVGQVVLGGDSGVTLRDMLAAAMLLKSKRVPPRLDLLLSPPSRQVLEVLAQSGALVDLVATGARILEPDHRITNGEIYPPPRGTLSLRTADPEPRVEGSPRFIVASAETLAYAVATGSVGDPRNFKRPVRVTVPRALPTDDVLVRRDKKGEQSTAKKPAPPAAPIPWKAATTLAVAFGVGETAQATGADASKGEKDKAAKATKTEGALLVLETFDELQALVARPLAREGVRAVLAPFVPSGFATLLASEGIAVLSAPADALSALKTQKTASLPALSQWEAKVQVTAGKAKIAAEWLAKDAEKTWTASGTARLHPPPKLGARR